MKTIILYLEILFLLGFYIFYNYINAVYSTALSLIISNITLFIISYYFAKRLSMIIKLGLLFKIDVIYRKFENYINQIRVERINKRLIQNLNLFLREWGVTIEGDLKQLKIDSTSHLKSNTFIECSGGVWLVSIFILEED